MTDLRNFLTSALGHQPKDMALYEQALTHGSASRTTYERLEFLGDSVLGLVTCEQLFLRFPEYQEGEMTKIKSAVVSRTACAQFSQEIQLGHFLFLGQGLRSGAELPLNLLADVFESLVAAIFLDGGMAAAHPFLLRFVNPEIDRVVRDAANNNYKSLLQQVAQREWGDTPKYLVLDEQGPDHARSFKIAVVIETHRYPAAWGQNKKIAESRAAQNALAEIGGEVSPFACDV